MKGTNVMTAAVAHVVYGISFSQGFSKYRKEINKLAEIEVLDSYYSSYDDDPVCIGVKLHTLYESEEIDITDIVLSPSTEQIEEFEKRFTQFLYNPCVSGDLKDIACNNKPKTFIMWGIS